MRGRRYLALAVIATAVTVAPWASAAQPRAVIELFTSQGCSSCPPADRLLGELTKDPSLIPLSLSIDYWDYLGWKDTLALTAHADRQKAYSRALGSGIYTPQAIVNGSAQALGSDRTAIEQAIVKTRTDDATLSLPLTLRVADGRLTVTAPAAKNGSVSNAAPAEVWLCPLTKSVKVAIGRGENSGHTFTYHNVVRRWVKLGDWTGIARNYKVPVTEVTNVGGDAVAVVVQAGPKDAPSTMLGAAIAALPWPIQRAE
jgi:hypothetical protein